MAAPVAAAAASGAGAGAGAGTGAGTGAAGAAGGADPTMVSQPAGASKFQGNDGDTSGQGGMVKKALQKIKNNKKLFLGGAFGAAQYIAGIIKKRQARGMQPLDEDPEVRQNLSRIQREATALRTGTDMSRTRQALDQNLKSMNRNALRISGGGLGTALVGQARNQKSIADALVKLDATGKAAASGKDQLISTVIDKISQRKLELQLMKQQKLEAEAAALKKGGFSNLTTAMGLDLDTGGSGTAEDINQKGN